MLSQICIEIIYNFAAGTNYCIFKKYNPNTNLKQIMIEDKKQRTELSELGEFGLIDHLTKNIKLKHESTIKGVGDDAAVIDSKDKQSVVTTDLLIEGVHFDLTYTPLKHLGYKAAIVNFSDVVIQMAKSNRRRRESITGVGPLE